MSSGSGSTLVSQLQHNPSNLTSADSQTDASRTSSMSEGSETWALKMGRYICFEWNICWGFQISGIFSWSFQLVYGGLFEDTSSSRNESEDENKEIFFHNSVVEDLSLANFKAFLSTRENRTYQVAHLCTNLNTKLAHHIINTCFCDKVPPGIWWA